MWPPHLNRRLMSLGTNSQPAMAIDGVPWSFTALLAVSLPPALLLLRARRSKRSENNSSSRRRRRSSSMREVRAGRYAIPRIQATRISWGRERVVTSLSPRAHTRLGSAAARVFLYACIAAVMIPDDVGAFLWRAGCILTVRELPALTMLPHSNSNSRSGWAQVLKADGACRRRPTSSYLAGKVVWITGASSGLGEQLALAAAAGGARGVIISGRREDALERVRQACEDARPSGWAEGAGGVRVLPFDVGDLSFVEKEATSRAVGEFGTIDALVLNAGISMRGSVEETSLDVDKRVMDVNYFGAVGLAKGLLEACAPPLHAPAEGWGARGQTGRSGDGSGGGGVWTGADVRFIVVNSVQGKFGVAFRSSYAASKHALVGFFDCLRAERASQGIGVLNVFPGYVRTSLSMNALTGDGSQYAKMDATTASGRDPREVADEIWEAAAGGKEEIVIADLKTNVAVLLRVLAPRVLFWIMAKRAAKEVAH